ncbi:MAG: hypothetical protein ACYC5M_13160 [Anaerolineae bacterium]
MRTPKVGTELEATRSSDLGVLIDSLASRVVERGLATPAVLLLELLKPWGFMCGQALLLLNPLVGKPQISGRSVVDLLEDRQNVELLLAAIEQRRP